MGVEEEDCSYALQPTKSTLRFDDFDDWNEDCLLLEDLFWEAPFFSCV